MPRAWCIDFDYRELDLRLQRLIAAGSRFRYDAPMTTPRPPGIQVGSLRLVETADGLVIVHPALQRPLPVSAASLQRWLMKIVRESLAEIPE